jgi:hypothetical protein
MMRWMVYGAGALALAIALVAVAGTMLPKKHRAARTARIALPPDALFRLLTEIRFGDVPVRVERQEPPSLLVTRIDGKDLPYGGTWTYTIAPAPGGSDLTITEDGEVYNVVFRFMSRFVFGHYATMDAFLDHLKRIVEEGKQ